MTTRLVILGASGDLARRYLLPALAQLEGAGRCPQLEIVGIGLEPWDDGTFKQQASASIEKHARSVSARVAKQLLERVTYVEGDVTDTSILRRALEGHRGTAIVYLALPPKVFAPAIEAAGALGRDDLRIVIEKPFGTSSASARDLNALLHRHFDEASVFRMDHFLGKQTVQNLLGLRFANRVFEPLWCAEHVQAVDVIWDEIVALEGRAGYYDGTGALRDMIQNHLLQVLALTAMERPAAPGAEPLRDAKAAVIEAVQPPGPEDIGTRTRRARYTQGRIADRDIPNYVDEDGVHGDRNTETFTEVMMLVDNDRWRDVPFRLRTGKALRAARREIHVHFRTVDPLPFAPQHDILPNRLVLQMDPDVMALEIALNGAGDPFRLEPARLDVELAPNELSAYAGLLLDTFDGDPSLSIRGDEAELSWRAVEPILDAWAAGASPLLEYPAGSAGPEDTLLQEPPPLDQTGGSAATVSVRKWD